MADPQINAFRDTGRALGLFVAGIVAFGLNVGIIYVRHAWWPGGLLTFLVPLGLWVLSTAFALRATRAGGSVLLSAFVLVFTVGYGILLWLYSRIGW